MPKPSPITRIRLLANSERGMASAIRSTYRALRKAGYTRLQVLVALGRAYGEGSLVVDPDAKFSPEPETTTEWTPGADVPRASE